MFHRGYTHYGLAGSFGAALFGGLLAVIGMAPFAVFMSELQILKAAANARAFWAMGFFLAGTCIVFVGALRHAMEAAWGESIVEPKAENAGWASRALIVGSLGALLLLGLWLPEPLSRAIERAAAVVRGG